MTKPQRKRVEKNRFYFDIHAINRVLQRRLPFHIVVGVANHGIPVQETEESKVVRGMWGDQPLHVVVLKPINVIKTVYIADEWEVDVNATRQQPQALAVSN